MMESPRRSWKTEGATRCGSERHGGPDPWVVGVPLGEGPRRRLATAHRLMDQGKQKDAAKVFESLAQGVLQAGLPRAPLLLLLAAKARSLATEAPQGVSLAQEGLPILSQMRLWRILDRAGIGFVAELRGLGQADEADELAARGSALCLWATRPLLGGPNPVRFAGCPLNARMAEPASRRTKSSRSTKELLSAADAGVRTALKGETSR